MRRVTWSMSVSLDGDMVGPNGGFDWTAAVPGGRHWSSSERSAGHSYRR